MGRAVTKRYDALRELDVPSVPEPSNIAVLEALTPKLPPMLSDMVGTRAKCDYVEYPVVGGDCFGFGVYTDPAGSVSVQRVRMDAGVEFPQHAHNETEVLVVYEGRIAVWLDGEARSTTLGVGESITLEPGQAHEVHALTKVWLIGITIPEGEGYPGGS